MIILFDANAFYISCENIFNHSWRGNAAVCLSSGDGMVVALNRQAKELGIKRGVPYFKIKTICDIKGVKISSSNFELYSSISNRLMATLGRYCPDHYTFSIDEQFHDLTRMRNVVSDVDEYCQTIRKAAWKEVRIPVSAGGGSTITLAKAASKYSKTRRYLNGVFIIDSEAKRIEVLKSLEIGDVFGIGNKTAQRLKFYGIKTAYDFAMLDHKKLRRDFNVEIERVNLELNSIKARFWDDVQVAVSSDRIYSTRSLSDRIVTLEELQESLARRTATAMAKLRKQQSLCTKLHIFCSESSFDTNAQSFQTVVALPHPTADTSFANGIVSKAAEKFMQEAKGPVRIYRVGVGLVNLSSAKNMQYDLLTEHVDNERLMNALDNLNTRYGKGALYFAVQGTSVNNTRINTRFLTQRYTTRWNEIPIINA